jgi:hypothetical protein
MWAMPAVGMADTVGAAVITVDTTVATTVVGTAATMDGVGTMDGPAILSDRGVGGEDTGLTITRATGGEALLTGTALQGNTKAQPRPRVSQAKASRQRGLRNPLSTRKTARAKSSRERIRSSAIAGQLVRPVSIPPRGRPAIARHTCGPKLPAWKAAATRSNSPAKYFSTSTPCRGKMPGF